MIRVEVAWPWDEAKSVEENFAPGEVLEKLAQLTGGHSWAAGSGFGMRDMSFEFKDVAGAAAFGDFVEEKFPTFKVSDVIEDTEES